jgi:hypothetical protein
MKSRKKKDKGDMAQVTLYLPPDTMAMVQAMAQAEDRPVSNMIARLTKEGIQARTAGKG